MFLPEEILELTQRVVKKLKKFDKKGKVERMDGALPEYWPGYNAAVNRMEAIQVHSEDDIFPSKLFMKRSPNEDKEEMEYRKDNYQPTTLPVFEDYMNTRGRAWHDSNWSIEYAQDEQRFIDGEETFQSYVEGEVPGYTSVENFSKNIMPAVKAKDAEGIIAVRPDKIPIVVDEESQEVRMDDETLLSPIPIYYTVEQLVSFESGVHAMVELKKKSVVSFGNTKMKVGRVYEFYDDVAIWRVVQVGKQIDFTFELQLFFQHNWMRLPVEKLKGNAKAVEENIRWISPFSSAVPNLNLMALNSSNLQISINKSVFPVRVMVGDPCDFTDKEDNQCNDGFIEFMDDKGNSHAKKCPGCNGMGLRSRVSPTRDLLIRPASREGDNDSSISTPMEYVSPDPAILQFLEKKIQGDEIKGRKILHLQTSSTESKGATQETATGKFLDQKATFAFVEPIADQEFDLYIFILDSVGWMRYGEFFNAPTVTKPVTFDFTTEADYIAQLAAAQEAGLPPAVLHAIIFKFLNTLYFNEKRSAKVFNLITKTDRLLTLSSDEVSMKLLRKTVTPAEEIIHCSAITIIGDLVAADSEFFEKPFDEQQKALRDEAAKIAVANGATEIETIVEDVAAS